ncbi:MAG: tetrahydrofolate synthase [Flavobacteriaceae bacterium]|nr:MAG: tetrahydrofolate synthase [Flavobacteriaceae bacterium]
MFKQLPMFQNIGNLALRLKLDNTLALCQKLGNPQEKLKIIHVGGTNGKGSTCALLASCLKEKGYKVGLFSSPHLKDFRERIKINGKTCSKKYVVEFVRENKETLENLNLSFFEMTTAMALDYFHQKKVDWVILEVGLGGRLDATNIVKPKASVITNIGLDHQKILGETLGEIAAEKAGIIKQNTPVFVGETTAETKKVFKKIAKQKNAPIFWVEKFSKKDFQSDLKGLYQQKNMHLAYTVLTQLKKELKLKEKHIEKGFSRVVKNTGFMGRWQVLGKKPLTIADVAHNTHGMLEISRQLKEIKYKKLHLVLGFVNDKKVEEIIDLFPKNAVFHFCQPNTERKFPIEKLKEKYENNLDCLFYSSVSEAYLSAQKKANNKDLIFIGGSNYVVSEIL